MGDIIKEKAKKEYPRDAKITPANALVELAKDVREIRNFIRYIRVTDGRRIGTAPYISGITAWAKKQMLAELTAAILGSTKTKVLTEQKQATGTRVKFKEE